MGNLPILYWKCQCGTRNDVKLRTERLKTDRKVCFIGKHCKKCRKKFSHGSIRSDGISPMKDGTEDEEMPQISEEEKSEMLKVRSRDLCTIMEACRSCGNFEHPSRHAHYNVKANEVYIGIVDGLKNVLNNGYSALQDDEVDRD
ncbi:hypothetical protein GQ607_014367 [Colletotrichum asianum]|uniref:Uncharacterized protein n=1 Tax=Colletotrichum asianum TaxID=702518 RepID=A0A8H3W1Y4_9PEZI|nr:hypothetical protein GQ607_014367 [Colletotrichum asianum]